MIDAVEKEGRELTLSQLPVARTLIGFITSPAVPFGADPFEITPPPPAPALAALGIRPQVRQETNFLSS